MQHRRVPVGAAEKQVINRLIPEPTSADLFSDPITYGMMAADHVDYGDLLRSFFLCRIYG